MKSTLTYLLAFVLICCTDSEYYKVQFENVDRLKTGDKVFIRGLEIGEVKVLTLDNENKILATIWIGRNIKITEGSAFTIHTDKFGTKHIEITLSESKTFLDPTKIQKGYVQPPDATTFSKLSKQELDSLSKNNPVFKLADTVLQIIRKTK